MTRQMEQSAPPCFTAQQWDEWRAMARTIPPSRSSTYCEDCTPEYQGRMIAELRCKHPQAAFETDKHGMIRGVRWPSERAKREAV